MSKTKMRHNIKNSWLSPVTELTAEEFESGILKAENDSFKSVQDSMNVFEKWMQRRSKK